tara:strand:- start:42 stop:212 length:171 start_codon:yes stop_codon:yes gene_type:complete
MKTKYIKGLTKPQLEYVHKLIQMELTWGDMNKIKENMLKRIEIKVIDTIHKYNYGG